MYFPYANYPYMDWHAINLDWILTTIKELKAKVDQMDMETLLNTLAQLESEINSVSSTVSGLSTQVGINTNDIERISGDLTTAQSEINALSSAVQAHTISILEIQTALSNIGTLLEPIEGEIQALTSQVNALGERVVALESATLNAPVLANENLFTINEFQDLSNLDYEIVEVTNNESASNNIQVASNLITFYPSSAYNEMALVLHKVLPILVGTYTASQILSFGCKYKTSRSTNGTDYCVNIPFTSLTGSSPYIANTDWTDPAGSLRVLQLKPNVDGIHYDLWIYNRYHGQYGITINANVSILSFAMVFRGFTASESTTTRKAFFTTCYGSKGAQVASLIDKKTPAIIQTCNNTASNYATIAQESAEASARTYATTAQEEAEANARSYTNDMYDITADEINSYIDDSSIAHDDLAGVSINAIQNLNSDVTVDYSNTKYGISHFTGTSFTYDTWSEEIRLFIDVEVTITGAGAVNTPASVPVVNISNTLGATIPNMIPLTVHTALPRYKPFTEAYLNTNGDVIFRCWFDDTGYDYNTSPITVRIAGFIPLPYTASSPD